MADPHATAREGVERALRYYVPDDRRRESALECLDALAADLAQARAALHKIAAWEPVAPLPHQQFLGGAYLPHGPVTGLARAALAERTNP